MLVGSRIAGVRPDGGSFGLAVPEVDSTTMTKCSSGRHGVEPGDPSGRISERRRTASEAAVGRFLRAFQVLLKSARLYDRDHPQVLQSLATAEVQLRAAQAAAPGRVVGVRVSEKSFFSAGSARAVPDARGELVPLAQDLARAGITTLAFPPDTHLGELANLAAMLGRKPVLVPARENDGERGDEVRRIGLPVEGAYTGDWAELLDAYRIEAIRINVLLEEPKADATIASLVGVVLSEVRSTAPQAEGPPQSVEELMGALRLLSQLGGVLAAHATAAPQHTLQLMREAVSAAGPRAAWIVEGAMSRATFSAGMDGEALDTYLERLTVGLALEFVTLRYEARRLTASDVRPLITRLAREMNSLGTAMAPSAPEASGPPMVPLVRAPWSEETWAEHLLERFWSELHASQKHETLHGHEAWCVPVAALRRYIEPGIRGPEASEREARATVLDYSRCLLAKDSVARLATATGLSELGEVIAKLWPDEPPNELVERVVWALVDEKAPEVAGLLSAVTASLAQLAFDRAHYAVIERILQILGQSQRDVASQNGGHLRELGTRILNEQRWQALVNASLENRPLDAALARLLGRDPDRLVESFATRLATGHLHAVPAMSRLAKAIGEPAIGALASHLLDPRTQVASAAVKLLAGTQPERLLAALPRALPGWDWNLQDLAVSELASGGSTGTASPDHGMQACAKIYLECIPLAHPLVVPMMLDQIGLAKEKTAVPLLVEIASGRQERLKDVFVRIKAVEALGRIGPTGEARSASGDAGAGEPADVLRQILRERQGLTHAEPAGLRAAAEEALGLIENWPSSARARTAREALEKSAVAHARPRRYMRIPLEAPLSARIVGPPEAPARVRTISLGGAFLETSGSRTARRAEGSRRLTIGEAIEVEIRAGLRRITGKAVVRNVGASGAGVEFIHMKQEDRERLRKLVSKLLRK